MQFVPKKDFIKQERIIYATFSLQEVEAMTENKPGFKRKRKMDNNLNMGNENTNKGSKENEDRFHKLAEKMPVLINAITDSKITELALQEEQAFLQVILNLTTEFINIPLDEYDSKINEMLGIIGEYTKMDRVYVNRHDYSRQVTSETHEWCAKGIPSQIISSQDTPFAFFSDLLSQAGY